MPRYLIDDLRSVPATTCPGTGSALAACVLSLLRVRAARKSSELVEPRPHHSRGAREGHSVFLGFVLRNISRARVPRNGMGPFRGNGECQGARRNQYCTTGASNSGFTAYVTDRRGGEQRPRSGPAVSGPGKARGRCCMTLGDRSVEMLLQPPAVGPRGDLLPGLKNFQHVKLPVRRLELPPSRCQRTAKRTIAAGPVDRCVEGSL